MKKFSPFMIFHLVLMSALFLSACFSMVMFIGGFKLAVEGRGMAEVLMNGLLLLVVIAMFAVGILYSLNEYGKKSAIYYKTFLLLLLAITILAIFLDTLFVAELHPLLTVKAVLYVVKALVLIGLVFWKDLGKTKTFALAFSLMALDIISVALWIVYLLGTSFNFSIIGGIAALVADITVLLAVKGKYKDKEERGSK